MTDTLARVTLADGPLAGYHPEVPVVADGVPLRFNSLVKPGHLQYDYHLRGKDVTTGEPVYEYAGPHESTIPLSEAGIDAPAHAFVPGDW